MFGAPQRGQHPRSTHEAGTDSSLGPTGSRESQSRRIRENRGHDSVVSVGRLPLPSHRLHRQGREFALEADDGVPMNKFPPSSALFDPTDELVSSPFDPEIFCEAEDRRFMRSSSRRSLEAPPERPG